jgi:hypothetical protein
MWRCFDQGCSTVHTARRSMCKSEEGRQSCALYISELDEPKEILHKEVVQVNDASLA